MKSVWTRRAFLGAAAAAAMAAPLAYGQAKRPNVLVLFTDDQRHDTIGALGNAYIRTPHMDRIVRRGAAFTQCYIQGSTVPAVCVCSRSMLLTGRSLYRSPGTIPADDPATMLPEVFRRAGYTTFGTGKWHSGKAAFARCFSAGEAIFFGGMHHPEDGGHENPAVYAFDPSGEYPASAELRPGVHSSELFADAAVRFIEERDAATPFFAFVSFSAPHDPRTAPAPYDTMYDPAETPLPGNFMAKHPFDNGELEIRDELLAPFPRTEDEMRQHIADYYAIITHMDSQIGRVLNALEASGAADNTIVVLAGDNGLAAGQHGLMGKQSLYDHSVRVPLIVAAPGETGRRIDAPVYLHDLLPTLCDLCDLETPETCESSSLAPLLEGAGQGPYENVFAAYRDVQRMVCDEQWKLIAYPAAGVTQLFDRANDPWELRNEADNYAHGETRKRLEAALADWQARTGDPLAVTR